MIKMLSTRRSCNRFSLCAGSDLALRRRGFLSSSVFSPLNLSPLLWLRADQGVYTGGARQLYSADKGHLQAPDSASLSMGDIDFTITGWVYFDTSGVTHGVVHKGVLHTATCEYGIYRWSNDKLYFTVGNGSTNNEVATAATVSASAWHYVICWHDATANTINIQVDNGTAASISYSSGSQDTSQPLKLGMLFDGVSEYLNGRESRFGIWKRTLTTAEKTWLYNSGNGRVYGELGVAATDGSDLLTSLSAYWNLNETSGTANAIDQHSTNDLVPTFAELLSNGGFETAGGGGADVFGSWTEGTAGSSTLTDETSLVHAGGHAMKMTTVDSTSVSARQDVMTHAHRYTYSVYTRSGDGTDQPRLYLGNGSVIYLSETTSYVQNTATFTADASGNGNFYLYTSLSAGSVYFDSASLVAVDIPAADGPANSTGVVDGDPVVIWQSIEGSAHQFLQATASKRPLYRSSAINSQPGIDGDGTDDILVKASAFLTGTAGTVVIVYRLDAVPNSYQACLGSSDEASAVSYFVLFSRGNTASPKINIESAVAGTYNSVEGNTTINVDTDYATLLSSNDTAWSGRVNSTSQTLTATTGSNNGRWWDDTSGKDNVTLFGAKRTSEVYFMSGKICEILVYSTQLTAAEITSLDSYIFARYGIHV